MRFKLTKQGFVFPYHGDNLVRTWPWSPQRASGKYSSELIPHFNTLKEYWVCRVNAGVGSTTRKPMINFSYLEVFAAWSAREFPATHVVVVHMINCGVRLDDFWKKLPLGTAARLAEADVSVFLCKDRATALELSFAIPEELGEAYLFKDGILIDSNSWRDE